MQRIASRCPFCLIILQLFQSDFVCNLHCSTSQPDHTLVLEMAKHSGNYLAGGAHVARDGFMGNLEDVCFLYPQLRAMYNENDGNTQVLFFKQAIVTFSSFAAPAETIEF